MEFTGIELNFGELTAIQENGSTFAHLSLIVHYAAAHLIRLHTTQ